jgi:hypothetical protein
MPLTKLRLKLPTIQSQKSFNQPIHIRQRTRALGQTKMAKAQLALWENTPPNRP